MYLMILLSGSIRRSVTPGFRWDCPPHSRINFNNFVKNSGLIPNRFFDVSNSDSKLTKIIKMVKNRRSRHSYSFGDQIYKISFLVQKTAGNHCYSKLNIDTIQSVFLWFPKSFSKNIKCRKNSWVFPFLSSNPTPHFKNDFIVLYFQ